ncbi:hypothetical protein Tco_0653592 [Tanacetum coccineum]|uniref:Secreted protein n=1 Tax=Tanacetum coccineum TaxID=301880 RepID=A0ABQ4X193_9ASTR
MRMMVAACCRGCEVQLWCSGWCGPWSGGWGSAEVAAVAMMMTMMATTAVVGGVEVAARKVVDQMDRGMWSTFGLGRNTHRKSFPVARGGGG